MSAFRAKEDITFAARMFATELVPGAKKVAMLGQASNRSIASVFRSVQNAAKSRDISVHLLEAAQSNEVDSAFETMAREHFDGFIVFAAPIMLRNSRQIVDLAARYRLPGVYARDNYVVIGGLLSYAPDRVAMFRTWAEQVHRVLKGAKPGDLPIQQPRKFIVTINLKKSKALGLTVPRSILLLADKVIEQVDASSAPSDTVGPKQTFHFAVPMSAFGGKADIEVKAVYFSF